MIMLVQVKFGCKYQKWVKNLTKPNLTYAVTIKPCIRLKKLTGNADQIQGEKKSISDIQQ